MKLDREASQLQNLDAFKPWLFRIARNEALMILRRRGKRSEEDPDSVWSEQTPLDALVRAETVELVQKFLFELKVEYREVLVLREYERLSYAEIALMTGASESSVKSRIFKARKALTDRLRPFFAS